MGKGATPRPSTSPASTRSSATTKHDVIAFLTHLAEIVGPEARFVHQGMTSSDVLDTCLQRAAHPRRRPADRRCRRLLAALKRRAFEHKDTITIGRSHGIHAEPTTFGIKLAQAYAEFARNRERLRRGAEEIATCAISGAVGTFANIDPRVEAYVAEKLGLARAVSTQVIPRDRHAMFFATLGVVASPSSGSPPRSATCSAPRCSRRRNISRPARRAPRPCRTSATRC
jgi:adenylosuccinate lyase